jgi:uncharacterized damage-inducible protein DinB
MSKTKQSLFVIGIVSLTLSTRVGAQQYATDPIKNSFEDFAGHYAQLLLAAFDSIPAAKYDFKPSPPQQSVGYIAQHLENANYNLCQKIGGMTRAMTARDSQPDSVKAAWPKDTLIARFRTSLYFCRDAFAKIDDAKMSDPVQLGPSGSKLTQPRVHALLFFVTDLAEHYAQIASYMRIMGMTPPSALPRPKS